MEVLNTSEALSKKNAHPKNENLVVTLDVTYTFDVPSIGCMSFYLCSF